MTRWDAPPDGFKSRIGEWIPTHLPSFIEEVQQELDRLMSGDFQSVCCDEHRRLCDSVLNDALGLESPCGRLNRELDASCFPRSQSPRCELGVSEAKTFQFCELDAIYAIVAAQSSDDAIAPAYYLIS